MSIVSERVKIFSFIALAFVLTIIDFALRDSTWQGSMQLHTIMESIATLLSFFVGLIALMHYNATNHKSFFIYRCRFCRNFIFRVLSCLGYIGNILSILSKSSAISTSMELDCRKIVSFRFSCLQFLLLCKKRQ